jgi:LexA-binding, inner membrane-associated putative hydrolase
MHVQTHIMSGWIAGNYLKLNARQRGFCMIAAAIPDLDGLSLLFGRDAYTSYHHLLCHNLLFAVISSAVLAWFSPRPARSFFIYFSLFHLHLLMDYYGSGPGWNIYYLFPFSRRSLYNPHAWDFYSWQNLTAAGILFVWTIVIAVRDGRTPLEAPMPNLDRQLVSWLRAKLPFLGRRK